MNTRILERLKDDLRRKGSLPVYQEDLIDDAIFALSRNNEYRAEKALETMIYNYERERDQLAANMVKMAMQGRY